MSIGFTPVENGQWIARSEAIPGAQWRIVVDRVQFSACLVPNDGFAISAELLKRCRCVYETFREAANFCVERERYLLDHAIRVIGEPEGQPLAARVLEMCRKRGWDMKWNARGCYLHLEASEFIEALRGKGNNPDPEKEAADVLLCLMSMTETAGIPWGRVLERLAVIVDELMTKPQYAGESTASGDIIKGIPKG